VEKEDDGMKTFKIMFAMILWITILSTSRGSPLGVCWNIGALFIIGDYINIEIKRLELKKEDMAWTRRTFRK